MPSKDWLKKLRERVKKHGDKVVTDKFMMRYKKIYVLIFKMFNNITNPTAVHCSK